MTEIGPERGEHEAPVEGAGGRAAAARAGVAAGVGRLPGARDGAPPGGAEDRPTASVFDLEGVTVRYGAVPAVRDVTFPIYRNRVTAIIGPSGCGKSTLIRCLNRMNDLVPAATVAGRVLYHGQDLYDPRVDPVEVRKRIGMVFQKPNPFPKSIYDNVAFGPRVLGMKDDMDEIVEGALRRGALWDDVKDRLKATASALPAAKRSRF